MASAASDELPMTLGGADFGFMGGSLGMAAGEAFIKGADIAARQEDALCAVRRLGRGAHAGGHPLAHADAAHHVAVRRLEHSPPCPMSSC